MAELLSIHCYFSAFQAAIAALQHAGIRPQGQWEHDFVRGEFEGRLIYRRKLYPAELRGLLKELSAVRRRADCAEDVVPRAEAERVLRRVRSFVATIEEGMHR